MAIPQDPMPSTSAAAEAAIKVPPSPPSPCGSSPKSMMMSPGPSSDSHLRTQVCAICQISTNSYHLNYGVSSCLSCRAFFRRIVQQKMKTAMKCKGGTGGACNITPENRKKCKKCRYEACLRAGMKSDAVFNEDQYKTWFRRMLRKQKKEGKMSGWGVKGSRSNSLERTISYSSDSESCGGNFRGFLDQQGIMEEGSQDLLSEVASANSNTKSSEESDLDFFLNAIELVNNNEGQQDNSNSPENSDGEEPLEILPIEKPVALKDEDFSLLRYKQYNVNVFLVKGICRWCIITICNFF